DRVGRPLDDELIDGSWGLGPNVRVVDLNRDHRPDLIRVFDGGYQVVENTSGAACAPGASCPQFGFRPGPERSLEYLEGSFLPDATWFHDVNGDGLVDLVARSADHLAVFYGLGQFEFGPE